jgi:hypothetical protein
MVASICLIEDSPYHRDFREVVEEEQFNKFLRYERNLSIPISSNDEDGAETVAYRSYCSLISNLENFDNSDGLIIVLDVMLDLNPEDLPENLRQEFDELANRAQILLGRELLSHYIFSFLLVKKVVDSGMQKCLIHINSSNIGGGDIDDIEGVIVSLFGNCIHITIQRGSGKSLRKKDNSRKEIERALNRFRRSHQLIVERLAFDFLHILSEGMTHPDNYEDINSNLFCYSLFENDNRSVEAYKSLFVLGFSNNETRRYMTVKVFTEVLRLSSIMVETKMHDLDQIQVPIQPGIFFIINLIIFLHSMNINQVHLSHNIEAGEIDLKFEVRDIERFSSALLTGNGRCSIYKFHALMACSKDIVYTYGAPNQYKTFNVFSDWSYRNQIPNVDEVRNMVQHCIPIPLAADNLSDCEIYPSFLRWERNWRLPGDNFIHVKWSSQSSHNNPEP